jgi:DNA-directed RNA polymerase specialized sigma24 family protein
MAATASESPDPLTPVANTATVGGVPQKRGLLTPEAQKRLTHALESRANAESDLRSAVLYAVENGGSVRELAAFTGLSTNTISRWKREAS